MTAFRELIRSICPGGRLLVLFLLDGPDLPAGGTAHLTSWFGGAPFPRPWSAAGFRIESTPRREPLDPVEFPSRRAYLPARRAGHLSGIVQAASSMVGNSSRTAFIGGSKGRWRAFRQRRTEAKSTV